MAFWDADVERDSLAEALGTENTAAFHLELYYQTSPFWDTPRRGDGTRFPCIDARNAYSGCLGSKCEAMSCWAGRLVASAVHAPVERIALPREERRGANCHMCLNAVDGDDGMIDCAAGHFDRSITSACLVRRRTPDTAPIPCPDFSRRSQLRADVIAYRRSRNKGKRYERA